MDLSNEFRLSVSKTKTFLNCKKQYHFSYVLKFPKKERDYHILGIFAHKVLENFHNIYISGSDLPYNKAMSVSFKDAYEEYKDRVTPEIKKEVKEIIDKYLKVIYTQQNHPLAGNVISCEKNFSISLKDNLILNGMIDRIQLDKDGVLHVADYKTTKNKKYLQNDFFQLITYCYALMLEDDSLSRIRASYVLLRHNFEYVTTEFTREEVLKIKNKYIEYADSILSEKEFQANPTFLCRACDFLEMCDEGKKMKNPSEVYGEISW